MEILLANHSSYPSEATSVDGIATAVGEQESCGLDLLTDGQSAWADPISHLPGRLAGVRLTDTARFPSADLEFRQPVIEAKLRCHRSLTADDFRHARGAATASVKAVLTGPCTLARLSHITTTAYRHAGDLGMDFATILAQEIRDLVGAGARHIQIDEPLLLQHPDDVRLMRDLLEPLRTAAGDDAEFSVTTFWGPAEALYAQLNSLPGEVLGVDLCSDGDLAGTIAATGSGKVLALGIVDGRSSRLEDPDSLAAVVTRVLHRYVHDRLYLQPSCGMASLPPDLARAKLELLGAVRERVLAP